MSKKKKCCTNCTNALCFPVWAVIIIGIALGLILILDKCEMHLGIMYYTDKHFIWYILAVTSIFLVTFFSFIFLILIKIPATCNFCRCFKNIWIILHIILLSILSLLIYLEQYYSLDDIIYILKKAEHISDSPKGKLTPWFINFQETKKCCGIKNSLDYGTIILPKTLIHKCPINKSTNSTIFKGCGIILVEMYVRCNISCYTYVIVMLVIGVIPFVVYTLTYREAKKLQKKEEEEDEEDEDEDENENENEVVNENNGVETSTSGHGGSTNHTPVTHKENNNNNSSVV